MPVFCQAGVGPEPAIFSRALPRAFHQETHIWSGLPQLRVPRVSPFTCPVEQPSFYVVRNSDLPPGHRPLGGTLICMRVKLWTAWGTAGSIFLLGLLEALADDHGDGPVPTFTGRQSFSGPPPP